MAHERNALKALAQELNTRYNEQGVDVFVETKSFEDFKDTQDAYNRYISEMADMTIFVLEGDIGDITRKEFKVAADSHNRKQSPEILVFLRNFDVETDGIRNIKDLLRDRLGEEFYYISYNDVSDLKFKAERRITQFISPTDYIRSMKKWRSRALLISLAALLGLGFLSVLLFSSSSKKRDYRWQPNEPMLLLMGGGSVEKCVELKYGISLDSITNAIYMGVPTGNLWNMLGEEYFKIDDIQKQNFYPIFMAASGIDIETTLKAIPAKAKLSSNILIFQVFLSNDTVKTFVSDDWREANPDCDFTKLDSASLTEIITRAYKDEFLYTTSPESGTLKAYSETILGNGLIDAGNKNKIGKVTLKELVSNKNSTHKVFNERTAVDGDFVLLGSDYYFPYTMNNHKKYEVRDRNNMPIYKKLYIYFVAYKDRNKESKTCDKYRIPGKVVWFVNQLHIKENNLWTWNEGDQFAIVNDKNVKCDKNGLVKLSTEISEKDND